MVNDINRNRLVCGGFFCDDSVVLTSPMFTSIQCYLRVLTILLMIAVILPGIFYILRL